MSSTIALTTSFQRLSTLMDTAGFNVNDLVKKNFYLKNTSATETVTIKFDTDTAVADELGTHVAPGDSIKGRDINVGRCWIKTSTASNIDVALQDLEYRPDSRPYSGISDDGTTVTIGEKAVFSKSVVETPIALTSAATIALNAALGNYFWYVAGHTTTINVTNLTAGQSIRILIISDGTNRVQTFGTGVTSTGTLATGTDATKGFEVVFTRNGGSTVGIESSRTAALVI